MPRKRKHSKPSIPTALDAANTDGVENVLTGLGMLGRDSSASTYFKQDAILSQYQTEAAYSSSGIARRIIDLVVDDALGKRIDCEIELYDELERLNVFTKLGELATLARLHGGAVMLLIAKDGLDDLSLPLNENGLKRIEKLAVFDRWEVSLGHRDYDNDPTSETYGDVMFYNITPRYGTPLKVHHSRVLRMDGHYLPPNLFRMNGDWGASVLQAVYQGYLGYLTMQSFLQTMAKEFSLTILRIQGLAQAYINGTESKIAKRANDAQVSKSIANLMLLDAESEDFKREFATVSGYSDMITKGMELLSADAGIPMTLLFGRSPEGMNATGESDQDNWYKVVERYQRVTLEPQLQHIIGLLELQSEWTDKPESFEWEWPTLQPLSELEQADVRLKTAQSDKIYAVDMQAVDPEYLFHDRHDGGFSTTLNYSEEALEEFMQGREVAPLPLDGEVGEQTQEEVGNEEF